MAHPKFKDTCKYCHRGGLRWVDNGDGWALMERNNQTGATRRHACTMAPASMRRRPATTPEGWTPIRSAPVEGVEYLTAKQQREIDAARFIEYMDNRGDPSDWDEYLASNAPGDQIEGILVVEDSTPRWIV